MLAFILVSLLMPKRGNLKKDAPLESHETFPLRWRRALLVFSSGEGMWEFLLSRPKLRPPQLGFAFKTNQQEVPQKQMAWFNFERWGQ